MRIHIEGLSFETIIGILPHERKKPQRIVVDATLDYLYETGSVLDYAEICERIESTMKKNRYALLEDALIDIGNMLTKHYPQVRDFRLKISKPDILPNANVGVTLTSADLL
jgi:dihydroneopterin aldolase